MLALDTMSESAPRLVLVEWVDSHATPGWQVVEGEEFLDEVLVCRSVGWLLLDGDTAKIIAPHLSQDNPQVDQQASGIMTIPACSVVRMVGLQEGSG